MKRAVKTSVWRRAQSGHLQTWIAYAERGVAHSQTRRKIWEAILSVVEVYAPLQPGERVLDIGCGLDTVLDFLPQVQGITVDSLAARLVPLGLSPRAVHVAGLFEHLPFVGGCFDRVFVMNVLDHVLSPAAGLKEAARVLRPGGVLVLSVDTYTGCKYLERRIKKWWTRVRGARTKHPWAFSPRDVHRLLAEAGFSAQGPDHVPGTKERRSLFVAKKL